MNIHFIAIGGKVMHALAVALKKRGFRVSGSDDAIFDPSASRLKAHSLYPESVGWFPEKITESLDAVILGMHAQTDNPELQKAQGLGLPIYSFPEYLFEQSKNKKRVVVAGSHGKTTITSMIMHVLGQTELDFNYMVGGEVQNFELPIRLSEDAPVMLFEGDEYLTSRIDLRPKFLHYHHSLAVISGLAWDHVNVYPTYESYQKAFRDFIAQTPADGKVFWSKDDAKLAEIIPQGDARFIPYQAPESVVKAEGTYLPHEGKEIPLRVFGSHNLQNIGAAKAICMELGVSEGTFYEAISTFVGAGQRLEKIKETKDMIAFRDYAHAPSKWQATTKAVREQYPDRHLVAILELHTYSSLDSQFFSHFKDTLAAADEVIIFCHAENLKIKNREVPEQEAIREAFNVSNLRLVTDSEALALTLPNKLTQATSLLFMSSGSFANFRIKTYLDTLLA
ncbi:MAG: Mur ligase family protein [Bacteroidota bacterium]